MNPSLQNRLAVALSAVLIPVFLGQWLMMSIAVQRINSDYVASRLRHDAETLLAALQFATEKGLPPQLIPARISPMYERPWSGHYYRMEVGDTVFRSRSLWDMELTVPPSDDASVHTLQGPNNETLLALTHRFYKQEQTITILVAEETSLSQQMVRATQFWYALLAMLAVGVLLVLQRAMVKRGLRPLEQARDEMHRLEQGTLQRLTTTSVPREILPFVDEINRLLANLTVQLQKSREASGNLAHTIRTPLTVLLQLTEKPEMDAHLALRQQMQHQIKTLDQLTGQVLKRASMAGATPGMPTIHIGSELSNLVEMIQKMYSARSVQIEADIPDGLFAMMDREDLLELAGNLLDNACKWARTKIRLTVSPAPGLRLTIEDDGPGCPPTHYAHILKRGGRADPSTPGHGIGLAVVNDIVTAYNGQMVFGHSRTLGGFHIQVQLDCTCRPSPTANAQTMQDAATAGNGHTCPHTSRARKSSNAS
ncbi:MAG: ATP-binding protein [Magnetococcus sp. DMHC-8]